MDGQNAFLEIWWPLFLVVALWSDLVREIMRYVSGGLLIYLLLVYFFNP
jgi:hypothetical protein